MKTCTKCKNDLLEENFFSDKKSKDGKQSHCKNCKSKQIREYYKANPDKQRKRTKEEGRERYEKNKVNFNFSRRMRMALNGFKDGASWEKLVGYNLLELKQHLETKFKPGMSWENYGMWHIDHKMPVSFFEIKSVHDAAFRKCWALENLQPLWAFDNLSKGNKVKTT